MILFVVHRQQVCAEVRSEIPPDRVNVIGVVLHVIVFNKKRRALDAIVVRLAFFQTARPREENVSKPAARTLPNLAAAMSGACLEAYSARSVIRISCCF